MSQSVIRSARPEDRDTILAFCVNTWEWGDYIEHVWERWLQDPEGRLFVATVDERPVGVVHIQLLNSDEAWLEGIRVDPAYRGRGLAKELTLAAFAEAMRRGAKVVRLTTGAANTRSIQIVEQNHMHRVGVFALYQVPQVAASPHKLLPQEQTRLATIDDLDEIIHYLNNSNIFPTVGGLYYVDFTGYSITAELLEKKIAARNVYLLHRWERLDGLAIAEAHVEHREKRLSVGYLDGTTIEAISLIAYDLYRYASTSNVEAIRIYAPDLVLVREALDGIDYTWEGSIFYTYERGLR